VTAATPPSGTALPATLAGRYELGGILGRGAHGEVRAAHDLRLDRDVAVKLLRHDVVDDPELRRRFVIEGRAAAQLVHPNAVAVFDAGDDVVPFLVMELVRGVSVANELARGPFDVGRACAVASQVLGALGAAHALGIVHRDIKPANVLLDGDDVAKVADFGVAKLATSIERTSTGLVVGTPAYLAPEVLAGTPASPASDLWAVGCLLHELLTGRKPFDGDDPLALVHAIVSTTPVRVDVLRPEVPHAVADVVARALRADVPARWTSAAEMAAALHSARSAGADVLAPGTRSTATPAPPAPAMAAMPATEAGLPLVPTAVWLAPGPMPAAEPTLPPRAQAPDGSRRRRAVVGSLLVAALAGAIAGVVGVARDGDDRWPQTPTNISSGDATTTTVVTAPTTVAPTTAPPTTAPPTTEATEPAGGDGNGNGRGNGDGNGRDDDD
jgi:tRNA A-37 threonylcarbamoyl transferase component Bud32